MEGMQIYGVIFFSPAVEVSARLSPHRSEHGWTNQKGFGSHMAKGLCWHYNLSLTFDSINLASLNTEVYLRNILTLLSIQMCFNTWRLQFWINESGSTGQWKDILKKGHPSAMQPCVEVVQNVFWIPQRDCASIREKWMCGKMKY